MSTFGKSLFDWEKDLTNRLAEQAARLGLSIGEIVDAGTLLRFALSRDQRIDSSIINPVTSLIQRLEAYSEQKNKKPATSADAEAVATFRNAYNRLSNLMFPVSAQTIRNCFPEYGSRFGPLRKMRSEANKLSYWLWIWSIVTLGIILFTVVGQEVLDAWFPLDEDSKTKLGLVRWHKFFFALSYLVPFLYGQLGACTYLLKSSHFYAANYTFNLARKPEYYNRMLLGFIAGGAIQLFVAQLYDDAGNVIYLSGAALGFLAGYQVDFLFTTIERIIQAILPKVGLESITRGKPKPDSLPSSAKDLGDLLLKAKDSKDKEAIRKAMENL